jgi:murein DD-endopeptidase MepM/ murein hydrolase activator NlpD
MLAKRKVTILVLPSSPHKRVFSISLPIPMLTLVSFALGILLFMASAGASRTYHLQQVEQESHRLGIENRLAESQIQDQQKRIEHLSQDILNIREKAGYVQNYLGLKPQVPRFVTIGQGGVELSPRSVALSSNSFSAEAHQAPGILTSHIASLSAQDIRQLNTGLQQIVGVLRERQEKLDHTPTISPVNPQGSWISSSYGVRISPFTGKEQFHPGLDIAGDEGTPILAPANGTVSFAGKDGTLGMTVRLKHDSVFETTYGHLRKVSLKKGQHMKRGEVIGFMGNSGKSTGTHVHYEITKNGKRVNPYPYMMDWKSDNLVMLAE